jgi:hypothetical protein
MSKKKTRFPATSDDEVPLKASWAMPSPPMQAISQPRRMMRNIRALLSERLAMIVLNGLLSGSLLSLVALPMVRVE